MADTKSARENVSPFWVDEGALGSLVPNDHAVLLFDGVCNLCNSAVRFIVDRDAKGYIKFAPLQSEIGRDILEACGLNPDVMDSLVLVEAGRCYQKSEAALRVAQHLSMPWRAATIFKLIPLALRDPLYDLIAGRRYKWFGRRDTCRMPTPEEEELFLG